MKKILIKILVLLLVFVGAMGIFAYIMNDETKMRTEDMQKATLPLVYIVYRDTDMNPMHGYLKPMDVTSVRDTLTPISTERTMTIRIQTFGSKVDDIYFEVFTADGKTSLENTKVTSITEGDDYILADFALKCSMRMSQEYVLKIQLKGGGRDIYYYTRVVEQDSLHTKEYLDFINGFSEKCLNRNADSLAVYLEPEYDVEQNNLAFLDVHTTTEQLQWGNLNPQIYYKSIPVIKELNETTATINQEYIISAVNGDGNVELYTVNEYFRLRYNDEVVMLLDFERTTNEIFNPDNGVLTENGIDLGITDSNISFISDSSCRYFAFVQGGELWSYSMDSGKMAKVFTFRQKENSDYRDIYGAHEIKVLRVSENGNISFMVAGYMNRGHHEGESGVALYQYDASNGGITELLFADTNRSFDLLREDVEELAFITDDLQTFSMLLDGDVYKIDLTTLEMTKKIEGIKKGCSAGSGSGRRFAYLKENLPFDSSNIVITDMNTGAVTEVGCAENERIRMIGYINESLVYGVADIADIDASHEGDELFPMKTLYILNEDQQVVKEYSDSDSGYYVLDGTITDRLLTMQRIRKDGSDWYEAAEDHIIDNTADETGIGLTTIISDRKQSEVLLLLGEMATDKAQVIRSRMVVQEEEKTVSIPIKVHDEDVYYVYAKGMLQNTYENANTAIIHADKSFGIVVDKNQHYIWERGNREDEAEIPIAQISPLILKGSMDMAALQSELTDKIVLNLAGCSMDQILYFISSGNPVIADTTDGVRILIGYDKWGNIRYYNPSPSGEEVYEEEYYDEETDSYRKESNKRTAAETYLLSDEDSLELFERSGNIFIGFLNRNKE